VPNAVFYGVVVNAMSVLLKGFPGLPARALACPGGLVTLVKGIAGL